MHEYVGPNRMQYSDAALAWATDIRRTLPETYLRHGGRRVPVACGRPDRACLEANDPSECADSETILLGIRRVFTAPEIHLLGGIGYFIALHRLFGNFDDSAPTDRSLLQGALLVDAALSAPAFKIRAACLAQK